ncbi:YaeQ family protein [Gilvimarinus sp. SDUM040013]|uniref:YaeQ family protein n=1 Tax=Gilvimarinus gilvus TaxID=3058038 RepID=A0ABU4RWM2_9GAMM|nr:YaeQ family protein [Gilvimarinus sp. SDUM040013]MDO3387018.1 YaeQ family protein [Gilvimarinus sp. SDUM040013]MDX6848088.1 YaeQ family protein [Gilvimarinus sp. SDUM040013]
MALGASVYKVTLNLSDTDRHVYLDTKLTLACHPSETEERMMVRLLAWCFCADEDLVFGKGLSTDDEPDLWQIDPTGAVENWIEVGQPSVDRIKKGRSRSARQTLFTCGRGRDQWWPGVASELAHFSHLTVKHLAPEETQALGLLAQKNMTISVCISDGAAYITQGDQNVTLNPTDNLD